MSQIHHFTYGLITPGMAYVMSVVGSTLGLICTRRAREGAPGWNRTRWLTLAAVTIGGAGIWLMHFLAMIGFTVDGADIRYNLPLTVLSAVIAMVVVGFGLFMVCRGERSIVRLIVAGTLTGIGVAGMHYTGMAAMKITGEVNYNTTLVAASIAVAIVACIVALWFALIVKGLLATAAAALIMGVAVAGMHYTAMAAVGVEAHGGHSAQGAQLINILLPVFLTACIMILVPLCIFLGLDTEEEENLREHVRDIRHSRRVKANLPVLPPASEDHLGRHRSPEPAA